MVNRVNVQMDKYAVVVNVVLLEHVVVENVSILIRVKNVRATRLLPNIIAKVVIITVF